MFYYKVTFGRGGGIIKYLELEGCSERLPLLLFQLLALNESSQCATDGGMGCEGGGGCGCRRERSSLGNRLLTLLLVCRQRSLR